MPNRTPTLRQLEILLALDEHKTISKVAQNLHISQPSVSIQLKNLADLYHVSLYQNHGKKIEFTQAGLEIINSAKQIFFSLESLNIQLDDIQGIKSGTLKLAVVSTAKYFLPILLGQFCKRYPKIDVELKIGNRQQIIDRFNNNKDDFYVFSQLLDSENLIAEPFIENPLVVVVPENHELNTKRKISLKKLSKYPFLFREKGSGTRHAIDEFCKANDLKLEKKMIIESNEAIKHSVAAELGIAILSRHTLDYIKEHGLVKINVEKFPIQSQWYLVSNKKRNTTVLAKAFHDFLQSEGLNILKENIKKY